MSSGDGGTSGMECFVTKVYRMYINTQKIHPGFRYLCGFLRK